ncbi:hypothetical protein G3I59_32940 [Amycolatopsis rubida]|uniref:Uncharacterized protein n=1 Tax=Amycolatopsis rubida TaxID=112413 RepID=A0ABX0C5H4_9PSEU|nr:hypothetical protein [Amycolatopsis rubida]MYW95277.1 hypothetical protein [Amycolatopsis rubida]NEC60266.1 hypothetical protein [Amycolatopsis rubida]
MDPRRSEPVAAASACVRELFADARVVVVGGSVLTDRRTPTSDLDPATPRAGIRSAGKTGRRKH